MVENKKKFLRRVTEKKITSKGPLKKKSTFKQLRIPDSYDAKIAKNCNLWTFWPVIQLIMSRDSRFLLFLHHNYQVSLNIKKFFFYVYPLKHVMKK